MAKKSKKISLLYLIGTALVVIGFCIPMFKGKILGGTSNGFDFINLDNFGFVTIGALLIFIGAVAGLIFSFNFIRQADLVKLIALVASIVGGVVLVIGFNQDKIYQTIAKGFLKTAYVGFYMIIAGWIISLIGYITKK